MPSGGQLSSVGRPSALRNQLKLRAESRRQRKPALVFVCVKALGAVYKIALEEKKRKKPPDDRRHQKSGFPVGMYTGPYFESPAQTHGKFSLFHSHFGDIAHDAPMRINSTLSGLIRRDSNPETRLRVRPLPRASVVMHTKVRHSQGPRHLLSCITRGNHTPAHS